MSFLLGALALLGILTTLFFKLIGVVSREALDALLKKYAATLRKTRK